VRGGGGGGGDFRVLRIITILSNKKTAMAARFLRTFWYAVLTALSNLTYLHCNTLHCNKEICD
jgi:hypothetical protein